MRKISVLIAIVMSLCMLSACGETKENKDDFIYPIIKDMDVNYRTVDIEIGSIGEQYNLTGRIRNPYSVNAKFVTVSGEIEKIYVKEWDSVKEGDKIAKLKSDDLDYEIAQQKLIRDSKKGTYDTLVANQGDKFEIEEARIDYELENNKYKQLLAQLESLTLYAPTSGYVSYISRSVGDQVSGSSTICTITDTSVKAVMCPTDRYGDATFGATVTIEQGSIVCEGTVIDRVNYNNSNQYVITYPAEYEFNESQQVDVIFQSNVKSDVMILPSKAVQSFGSTDFVYILVGNMKVKMNVEVGLEIGGRVEIISGLTGDEKVIVG